MEKLLTLIHLAAFTLCLSQNFTPFCAFTLLTIFTKLKTTTNSFIFRLRNDLPTQKCRPETKLHLCPRRSRRCPTNFMYKLIRLRKPHPRKTTSHVQLARWVPLRRQPCHHQVQRQLRTLTTDPMDCRKFLEMEF